MRLCLYLLIFLPSSFALASPEPKWNGPWKTVSELETVLSAVPKGQEILSSAEKRDPDFRTKIRKGTSSFTESTFQRSYSLLDGSEQVEQKFRISLNEKLNLAQATLDYAHELVHFSLKEMQDPYQSNFQLKSFVQNGIEGKGGELAALEQECLIAWELEQRFRNFPVHSLCVAYRSSAGDFLRDKAKKDYYALGHYYYSVPDHLKETFPQVSFNAVRFSSSYAKKPYPVALYEEFYQSKRSACENNRKKWELISAQSQRGRNPASENLTGLKKKLIEFQKRNCLELPRDKQ